YCIDCNRTTKSITRYCNDCRPAEAHPFVHKVPGGISFAGHTYTEAQARHLADAIHDCIEETP
uniref:hypothetical protein n=1 Tax=Gordonia aichiensis TaxID=36820 RepID=UPI0032638B61